MGETNLSGTIPYENEPMVEYSVYVCGCMGTLCVNVSVCERVNANVCVCVCECVCACVCMCACVWCKWLNMSLPSKGKVVVMH